VRFYFKICLIPEKMKTSFLVLFSFLLLLTVGDLSAQKTIENHWGKKGFDGAFCIAASNDGGYIISGLTKSQGDPVGDIIVIKTGAHGDTLWTMKYGGPKLEGGNSAMQTSDGGYMISGHTEDFGAKDCDAFLMKLDKNGNHEWFKVYGGDSDDISECVVELPGEGYVFSGITASYGNGPTSGNCHMYFVKTDTKGNTIWERHYGGAGVEYSYSIAKTAGGGFLATGFSTSWGKGEDDGWLLKLNETGDTIWTRLYKSGGGIRFFQILPTLDGGFMMSGYTYPEKGDKSHGLIVKLDKDGKELWQKTYGGSTEDVALNGVAQLPNGSFIFTGISRKTDPKGNVYILNTDADGNKISDEVYGGSNSYANAIAVQGNNSYMTVGSTAKWGDATGDLYYMEMDNTQAGITSIALNEKSLFIYPDPIKDAGIIVLPADAANQSTNLVVMNISGQVVLSKQNGPASEIVLKREGLPSGLYFFRIAVADGKVCYGKFVAE
jgi:hypothetical protein